MSRTTRIAVVLALVVALASPHISAAASGDRQHSGAPATAEDWLSRLWEPFARLLALAGAESTAGSDDPADVPVSATPSAPQNPAAESTDSSDGEGDGGPTMDPDG